LVPKVLLALLVPALKVLLVLVVPLVLQMLNLTKVLEVHEVIQVLLVLLVPVLKALLVQEVTEDLQETEVTKVQLVLEATQVLLALKVYQVVKEKLVLYNLILWMIYDMFYNLLQEFLHHIVFHNLNIFY
jgi:hypothetical protein